jgi:hypothetical protein
MTRAWAALFPGIVLSACAPAVGEAPRAGQAPIAADSAQSAAAESAAAPSAAPATSATASASASAAPPAPSADEPKLPDGFVRGPEGPGERAKCGSFELVAEAGPDPAIPFVRVFDQSGTKIYEAHGRRMGVYGTQWLGAPWCGDLTGDGIPEIFLAESTMGAHCCHTYYLVSLTRPTKTLLMWEKGDGGFGMTPKKLKPGKAWQVVSYDLIEPPFNGEEGDPVIAGYAGIPSYPIIFDFVGGEYKRRTLAFPEALVDMRRKMREDCGKDKSCDDLVLFDWGYSLMIGDWDKERRAITDAQLLKSLDRHAAEMRRTLASRLGK